MVVFLLLIIIFILIAKGYLKIGPQARGEYGENKVKAIIGETVENEQYVINNLILSNGTRTSQVDHIVINPRGVFVIETKNYSGRIYGSENQHEWTQVLAYGNRKQKMYNPLKQNATHVYNVKRVIGNIPIHSLVVFVQNNTQYINASNVIPLSALKSTLNYGANILSTQQMKLAYNALLNSRAATTTEEHVRNIESLHANLAQGICPRCNHKLVLRNGKNGNFWGCSNYPQCRFTKKR